jgi:hypothetical protein
MHSLLKICKKKHIFFEWIFIQKTLKFKIVVDSFDVYQYHTP